MSITRLQVMKCRRVVSAQRSIEMQSVEGVAEKTLAL